MYVQFFPKLFFNPHFSPLFLVLVFSKILFSCFFQTNNDFSTKFCPALRTPSHYLPDCMYTSSAYNFLNHKSEIHHREDHTLCQRAPTPLSSSVSTSFSKQTGVSTRTIRFKYQLLFASNTFQKSNKEVLCASRESNPDLNLGKVAFYH